jgi:hypothetical protein
VESSQRLYFVHARYTGRDNSIAEFTVRQRVRGGAVKFFKATYGIQSMAVLRVLSYNSIDLLTCQHCIHADTHKFKKYMKH